MFIVFIMYIFYLFIFLKKMPQMDNEFFLVYFSCISTLLIYFMIDDNISESFIVRNIRYHLYFYLKTTRYIFDFESYILKNLILRRLTDFVRTKR